MVADRSDPRAPRPLRTLDTPGEAMGLEVDVANQLLYVADGNAGVITIDLATGERLQQLDTPGYSWTSPGLGHAFVSDRKGGLRILSLADPRQPREVGKLLEGAGEVLDVAVVGSRLWVSGGPCGGAGAGCHRSGRAQAHGQPHRRRPGHRHAGGR